MTGRPRGGDLLPAADVRHADRAIRAHVRRTPVLEVDLRDLDPAGPAGSALLKLEHLQVAGSFKARGAFANLTLREVPPAGVVAASGGNHGVAVAYAAHRLGVPATVFVPTVAGAEKIARIRALGATLVVGGDRYSDAAAAALEHHTRTGALGVHAFDQRETLLGQATLGLELDDQVADLETVLVPVGGAGLVAGVAGWFSGAVRVVGVEPDQAPTLTRARGAGRPVDAPTGGVAVDVLAPRRVGELAYPLTARYVDDVVLVDDEAITAARDALWDAARLLVEPAGAVAVAALLAGAYRPAPGERVLAVLTGANTAR